MLMKKIKNMSKTSFMKSKYWKLFFMFELLNKILLPQTNKKYIWKQFLKIDFLKIY